MQPGLFLMKSAFLLGRGGPSEELKCRAVDNGMDMAVALERVELASDVDEEMEESSLT